MRLGCFNVNPENPKIRGTAQNPDVFFQAREAGNIFYDNLPKIVEETMEEFGKLTGRVYKPFSYSGHPEAEKVIVLMGSGAGAVEETVDHLEGLNEKVGYINVHLYRPFNIESFMSVLPKTVKQIAVLDRTRLYHRKTRMRSHPTIHQHQCRKNE